MTAAPFAPARPFRRSVGDVAPNGVNPGGANPEGTVRGRFAARSEGDILCGPSPSGRNRSED